MFGKPSMLHLFNLRQTSDEFFFSPRSKTIIHNVAGDALVAYGESTASEDEMEKHSNNNRKN